MHRLTLHRIRRPGFRISHLLALVWIGVPLAALGASVELECKETTLRLSTGSDGGDCLLDPGVRALCADATSNSGYARCDEGCLFTAGTASCALATEESDAASFVLVCENGSRYLLRIRTGRASCNARAEEGTRSARCADGKDNVAAVSCKSGCQTTRGKALCARYKPEAGKR